MFYELLSAKAGIYTHQQHHIYILDNIFQHSYRSSRIQRDSWLHTGFTYLLHYPVQVRTCFEMHVHGVCPQRFHFMNEFLGLYYHQMYIQRLL